MPDLPVFDKSIPWQTTCCLINAYTVLIKTASSILSVCLCGTSMTLAADKPRVAPASTAANESSAESGSRAGAETVAAIETLGANPSNRQISGIVFNSVRNSPANVLAIVDAAVRVSPQAAAPDIVTAATAAVPDPWKQVTYRRITARHAKSGRDGADGKHVVDLDSHPARNGAGNAPGDPAGENALSLSLAEAIARTAFDAQPGLSFPALQAAADIALRTDPSTLLRNIQSPRTASGVGDAGNSNFANEPLRARVRGGNVVPVPNPPVVSR